MADKAALVEAVRTDPNVGRGTCTNIDECFSDDELFEDLLKDCKTPEEAVKAAYEFEGLKLEQALNARWGEDDDPQLIAYNEWNEKVK
jgi:hypothetical protein